MKLDQTNKRVLITGCSGGGKSTLLAELAARGFAVVEEPGRRIIRQELEGNGKALPWNEVAAFARRAVEVARHDYETVEDKTGWVFFDRGIIDACAALQHVTGEPLKKDVLTANPYHQRVFLAPPWPEIYAADPERQHSFNDAVGEYERLAALLPTLGYEVSILPKVSVRERANAIIEELLEPEDVAAARAILTALNLVLGDNGQKPVSKQQAVNELIPGSVSLRNWFLYLVDEALLHDTEHQDHVRAIRKALAFRPKTFQKACEKAIEIVT
ncbi:hypothetical protein FIV00_03300 [Labrenzia sp. THAF82]|nr:hypothetical protein FIV00_03300 [Labrenzia sp. THAF82]